MEKKAGNSVQPVQPVQAERIDAQLIAICGRHLQALEDARCSEIVMTLGA